MKINTNIPSYLTTAVKADIENIVLPCTLFRRIKSDFFMPPGATSFPVTAFSSEGGTDTECLSVIVEALTGGNQPAWKAAHYNIISEKEHYTYWGCACIAVSMGCEIYDAAGNLFGELCVIHAPHTLMFSHAELRVKLPAGILFPAAKKYSDFIKKGIRLKLAASNTVKSYPGTFVDLALDTSYEINVPELDV